MSGIFPSEQHRKLLLTTLKTLGVTNVEVTFAGGGDSGSIEDVCLNTASGLLSETEAARPLVWPVKSSSFDQDAGGWVQTVKDESKSLHEIVESVVYEALNQTDEDWYNNEGGSGTFVIDLAANPPKIHVDMHIYTRASDNYKFDFTRNGVNKKYLGRTDND